MTTTETHPPTEHKKRGRRVYATMGGLAAVVFLGGYAVGHSPAPETVTTAPAPTQTVTVTAPSADCLDALDKADALDAAQNGALAAAGHGFDAVSRLDSDDLDTATEQLRGFTGPMPGRARAYQLAASACRADTQAGA